MSYMKQYESDLESLCLRASYAAWEPTSNLRNKALTEVLNDCVKASQIYPGPEIVGQLLLGEVCRQYLVVREQTHQNRAA